jgi:hypothetical protein
MQDDLLRSARGGVSYCGPVRQVLAPDPSRRKKAILDLGSVHPSTSCSLLLTSTAGVVRAAGARVFIWSCYSELTSRRVTDMAREFPHCEAVGVDLVPIQSKYVPPFPPAQASY